jgi:methionyl-tRNA formyltransferase
MRIVIVMSEASLWKPRFVQQLIERLPNRHAIVGAVLTSFRPPKTSWFKHVRRYAMMLGPYVFCLVAAREAYHKILDRVFRFVPLKQEHSIRGVCRRHQIPVVMSPDVNDFDTVAWMKRLEPDIILSSGNQIFKESTLAVPSKGCLNRHTSLLPAYAGIYPIFWCLLNDEKEVGVSVHTMLKEVDKGQIVAQESLSVAPRDTFFSLFERCFALSVDVVLQAIDRIDSGDWKPIMNSRTPSYYSYPTRHDIRQFRHKGKRML